MSSGFWINFNPAANTVLNNLSSVNQQIQQESQVMSTGNMVNSASDNPAAYAISQNMQLESTGLNTAVQNAQQGVAMLQTAAGAQQQVLGILQTMNQLATQAAQSGTQTVSDRAGLQNEMNSLAQEINSITNQTQYNGLNVLSGMFSNATGASAVTLQVGASQGQTIQFNIGATDAQTLGVAGEQATSYTGYASVAGSVSNTGLTGTLPTGSLASGSSLSLSSNTILENGDYQIVFNGSYYTGSGTTGSLTQGTLQLQISNGNGTWENVGTATQVTAGSATVTVGDKNTGADVTIDFNSTAFGTATLSTAATTGTYSQTDKFSLTGSVATSGTANNGWQAQSNVVGLSILSQNGASQAITQIQNAIETLTAQTEQVGAVQNRLSATISDLQNTSSNLETANHVIVGANLAQEQAQFAQSQILEQGGISVLAQVNQQPALLLKLLG